MTNQGHYEPCWTPCVCGETSSRNCPIHGNSDEAYAAAAGYRLNIAGMTPEGHALDVADRAHELILDKYRRGQAEHGGQLWRKQGLLDMAIEEAVDMVVYLLTLRDQVAQAGVTLGDVTE